MEININVQSVLSFVCILYLVIWMAMLESSCTCVFTDTIISSIIVHNIYSFTIVFSLISAFRFSTGFSEIHTKPSVAPGSAQEVLHSRAPSYRNWLILSFVVRPSQFLIIITGKAVSGLKDPE